MARRRISGFRGRERKGLSRMRSSRASPTKASFFSSSPGAMARRPQAGIRPRWRARRPGISRFASFANTACSTAGKRRSTTPRCTANPLEALTVFGHSLCFRGEPKTMTAIADPIARAAGLACWSGRVAPEPLTGGITNKNYLVRDRRERFVVRIGDDIPVHQVMRFNELAASRAAAAVGLSPQVVHSEPGALVFGFIEGKTLAAEDVRPRPMLARILPLIRRCHREMPQHLRGPALIFWVFHIVRDYAATLQEGKSRWMAELPRLLRAAAALEAAIGRIDVVYGHNDLLPANFIDDGTRLWLIDWDYAGFNSPLFDLGNLCSNNEVAPEDEDWLLEAYFERPLDDGLRRRYQTMKCASLLREAMWGMVSEIHSTLDFDYRAYASDYLARFERAYAQLEQD